MQNELERTEKEHYINILTYGCSAHILNLLAKDIKISNVKAQVVDVIKYFYNNHFASAKLREAGGKKLQLSSDIDNGIAKKITDFVLKCNSLEDYLLRIKPIVIACDTAQKDKCTISEVVEVWKTFKKKMEVCVNLSTRKQIERAVADRYKMEMSQAHSWQTLWIHALKVRHLQLMSMSRP
ncbi:hypothetical protein JTE90_013386 [Oedothorax gibbosus]|uniref:DUF659 domain-containing protein n=1 Tax=Oedothorax gibbosus TaxID=931172 RepID=A0AAV6TVY2_9ARAC|nr:hypothetical protein JTE90_013386 [Oedothorax gibbosus]